MDANAEGTPLAKPYFNKKLKKWIVPKGHAAIWKPGPCAAWEVGFCPISDDKCTCAHLTRHVLNEKNQCNGIGNYVECTLPARCKYVLQMIKSGAWSYMKGLVMPDAPCLVELLEWLREQSDVDLVHSFIAENKIVKDPFLRGKVNDLLAEDYRRYARYDGRGESWADTACKEDV